MATPLFAGRTEILLERPRVFAEKLQRMKQAKKAVWQEAKRSEPEGFRLLLLWGCHPTPFSNWGI